MIALDNFQRMKRRVEEIDSLIAEEKGAIKLMEKQVADRFGCKDHEARINKLAKLERRRERLFDEYNEAKKVFEKKWGDRLGKL